MGIEAGSATKFLAHEGWTTSEQDAVSANMGVLQKVYAIVVRGEFDALTEFFTEDIEADIRGFGPPMDGHWRGPRQVIEGMRVNFGMLDGQKPEIEGMISQGDSIAVLIRESGVFKDSVREYRLRGVQWFRFAGGKIARIDEVVASVS
jgi:ketosteroid isomerase-like protein